MKMPTEAEIRLAAGELTAGEMRTVKAVLQWFINTRCSEAMQPFTKIGILHRRREGSVDFLQEAEVIPLEVHGTLDVYMRQSAGEGKE